MDIEEKNYRLSRLEEVFVGSLNDEDMKLFEEAVSQGCAKRVYNDVAGLLGLAKVKLIYIPKPMK